MIIHLIFAAITLQSVNLSNIKLLPIVSAVELTDYLGDDGFFIYSMSKICGIYKITSPKGRIYIGQAIDIHFRWKFYKRLDCNGQPRLCRSLKKHGVENHTFEIIHECSPEQLDKLEKHYVDLFKTFNTEHGLNLRDGGGSRGAVSEETKQKISQANSGKIRTEEYKRKLSEAIKGENHPNFGKHLSKKTREKIRKANTGKKCLEETKIKLRNINLGKKHTEETKKKMSEAQKGKKHPNFGKKASKELRKKLSDSHKGKKLSEEQKKKIGAKSKGNQYRLGKYHSEKSKKLISQSLNKYHKKIIK